MTVSNNNTNFVTNYSKTLALNTEHPFWGIANISPFPAMHIEPGASRDVVKARVRQLAKAQVSAKFAQTLDEALLVSNEQTYAVKQNGQPVSSMIIPGGSIFVPSNPLNEQAVDAVFTLVRTLRPDERKGVVEDYAAEIDRIVAAYGVKFGISRFYVVGQGCMSVTGVLEGDDIVIDPDVQSCPVCPHDGMCYHRIAAYQHLGVRTILPGWTREYFNAMSAVYEAALMGDKKQVFTLALKGVLAGIARKDAVEAHKAGREARKVVISLSK
jgi:hypothetical protein